MIFNNRLFLAEEGHSRDATRSEFNRTANPVHFVNTSHVVVASAEENQFEVKMRPTAAADPGIVLVEYVGSGSQSSR